MLKKYRQSIQTAYIYMRLQYDTCCLGLFYIEIYRKIIHILYYNINLYNTKFHLNKQNFYSFLQHLFYDFLIL